MTADQAAISRSPLGVTEHDMTPGWRVIVARRADISRTFYHHVNDDKRLIEALRQAAQSWAVPL